MTDYYAPVTFDPPKDDDNGFIVPKFCCAGDHPTEEPLPPLTPLQLAPAYPQAQLVTADFASHAIQASHIPLEPTHVEPRSSQVPPASTSPSTQRIKPYDVAQALMRAVPLYVIDECLFVFNGCIYEPKTGEAAKRFIIRNCRACVQAVGEPQFVKQVYEFLRAEPDIERKGLHDSKRFVALENGLLDLETFHLGPFDASLFVTARINGQFSPAIADECPTFTKFLQTVCGGDPLLIQRFWQAVGYCLVPDTAGKVFFLAQGHPNSGKSVLGEFIASCFDEDAVTSLDFNALGQQFGPAELLGKRLCLCMDLPAAPWNSCAVGLLKSLTGNDLVSADIKYQPRVRFRNTATFLFGTNHAVTTTLKDDAFLQRMVTLPFQFSVKRECQDPHLLDRLHIEKDAIITKAIYAYQQLRKQSYVFAGDYPVNAVISQQFTGEVIDWSQAVADFFYQACSLEEDTIVFADELYQSFISVFPGLSDLTTFSSKLYTFLELTFPGRVEKIRRRRSGGKNPLSAFRGIKLIS